MKVTKFDPRQYANWIFDQIDDRTTTTPMAVWESLVRWASFTRSTVMFAAFNSASYDFDADDAESRGCMDLLTALASKQWANYKEFVLGLQGSLEKLEPWASAALSGPFYTRATMLSCVVAVLGMSVWCFLFMTKGVSSPVIPAGCGLMVVIPVVLNRWYQAKAERLLREIF